MDTTYFLQGIVFEWDKNKARSNVRKHGVTFEEVAELFFDPFYQTGDASMDEEQRDFMIELQLRPRPATAVSLRIPDDKLVSAILQEIRVETVG